jgi:hypothetical protein
MQTNKYNFACKIELKAMMVDNIANHNNTNYSSVESQTNKYDNDYIWLELKKKTYDYSRNTDSDFQYERKLDMFSRNEMLTSPSW